MTNKVYFLWPVLLVILMITGCQTEELPDEPSYRLVMIADNAEMENPLHIFEYDSYGRPIKVIHTTERYNEIEYNQNGKPVKILYYNLDYGPDPERITNIERGEKSFSISGSEGNWKTIYNLKHENHLESIIWISRNSSTLDYDTIASLTYTITEDKEVMVAGRHPQANIEWEEKFLLGNWISPFKGIDLSVILLSEICYGIWDREFQNEFGVISYETELHNLTLNYDPAHGNYPARVEVFYAIDYQENFYFLYEEY